MILFITSLQLKGFLLTKNAERRRGLLGQPKPVVERWWRLRARRFGARFGRMLARARLARSERKRNQVLVSTFETIKSLAIRNENGNFPANSTMYNIGLYLLIAHRDIQSIKIDALTHKDEWTRKLLARIILLTIYEWDADKVTGRELKRSMELMHIPDALKMEAIECLRRLRLVQRKAGTQFSHVRNVAIAHRDPDALLQYRAIRDLDVNKVFQIAVEFFAAIEIFIDVQTRILQAGNTLPALLSQWSAAQGGERRK